MTVVSAGALYLPRWARGNVAVEGPDEDAFTMAVRVGEMLRRTQRNPPGTRAEVRKVRVLSSLSGDERGSLFEAWGFPAVETVAYPDTPAGAVQALSEAIDEETSPLDGPSWMLAVQTSGASGSGGAPTLNEPPRRSSLAVALAWVGTSTSQGAVVPESAPRTWVTGEGAKPHGGAELPAVPGLRASAEAPAAMLLKLLDLSSRAGAAGPGSWVHATADRTAVRTVLDGREVPVEGYPVPDGRLWLEVEEEPWRSRAGAPLGLVSQGAYLSRESYLASLPARWRLEGEKCAKCGAFSLPPAGRCHRCGAREGLRRGRLPRTGASLESATVIHKGAQPTEFDWHQETYGSYGVGLVRFPEGPALTLQITDQHPAEAAVGAEVELVLRRLYPQEGAWRYGLKAVVVPKV